MNGPIVNTTGRVVIGQQTHIPADADVWTQERYRARLTRSVTRTIETRRKNGKPDVDPTTRQIVEQIDDDGSVRVAEFAMLAKQPIQWRRVMEVVLILLGSAALIGAGALLARWLDKDDTKDWEGWPE